MLQYVPNKNMACVQLKEAIAVVKHWSVHETTTSMICNPLASYVIGCIMSIYQI